MHDEGSGLRDEADELLLVVNVELIAHRNIAITQRLIWRELHIRRIASSQLQSTMPLRSNFRWVICGLLFFAAVINYIDRQVIGILKSTLQELLFSTNVPMPQSFLVSKRPMPLDCWLPVELWIVFWIAISCDLSCS